MVRIIFMFVLATSILAAVPLAEAQQPKVYRVGVLLPGGAWYETIDGLRVGLRQLGLEEGKQFILAIRDTKGNAKAAEEAARNLEQEKVNLIYTTPTSSHHSSKAGDGRHPHRFLCRDRPGCSRARGELRKTGGKTHRRLLPGHRPHREALEILKEIVPKLRRVVTFYDPRNPVAIESSKLAREAARQWESSLSNGTSLPSRNFRRVCERSGQGSGCLLHSVGPDGE